jgi:DNA anti-recombination protein RmuC
MTSTNGGHPAGPTDRIERIETALEVLIGAVQQLTVSTAETNHIAHSNARAIEANNATWIEVRRILASQAERTEQAIASQAERMERAITELGERMERANAELGERIEQVNAELGERIEKVNQVATNNLITIVDCFDRLSDRIDRLDRPDSEGGNP